jgi:quinol monooxygenase YgiN
MTTLVLVEATPQPGRAQDLVDYFKRNFHAREHNGFHDAATYVSEDESTVIVTQFWDSVADFEAYLGWRETVSSMAEYEALLQAEPTTRYFELR